MNKLHKYKDKLETAKAAARAKMDDECTFHPQLLGNRASSSKCKTPSRLYDKAMKQIKKKDDIHEELGHGKDGNCTFAPMINAISKRSPGHKANAKRLYNLDKLTKKKLEMEQLRIARETQECTFSPEVRVAHDDDEDQGPDVHHRLFGLANKYEQKRMLRGEQLTTEFMAEHTFTPNLEKKTPEPSAPIPQASSKWVPPPLRKNVAPPSAAFDRLYTHAIKKNAKKIENYQAAGYMADVMSPSNPNFACELIRLGYKAGVMSPSNPNYRRELIRLGYKADVMSPSNPNYRRELIRGIVIHISSACLLLLS